MLKQMLQDTIAQISVPGKGILAADESTGTIAKRFATIQVESTEENHRIYRELLFTTPHLNRYISGIILYEETLKQRTKNGELFPTYLQNNGIVPGIKVDKGLIALAESPEEKITEGLDGLIQRLKEYQQIGAKFAKWRAVFNISEWHPSQLAITANAECLARYAAICQSIGIVPIVEPEVLIDGNHTLQQCAVATESVLEGVFKALELHHVILELMILKPSMVLPGKESSKVSVKEVAQATVDVLRRTVPAAVPTINFLSGGQTPLEATAHLNAMNQLGNQPWNLSFSYGRALQEPSLNAWRGKTENMLEAQKQLYHYAEINSKATLGKYQ